MAFPDSVGTSRLANAGSPSHSLGTSTQLSVVITIEVNIALRLAFTLLLDCLCEIGWDVPMVPQEVGDVPAYVYRWPSRILGPVSVIILFKVCTY
jgi:hypothetical protein